VALILLACACQQPRQKFVGDWPVPTLTLPAGATELSGKKPADSGGTLSSQTWTKAFRCDDDWETVRAHVEGCLKPLGYREFWAESPQIGDTRLTGRDYYSADGLTHVQLMNLDKPERRADPAKATFMIMIKLLDAPDPLLAKAGQSLADGGSVHLEPLK
jgi:hypothetical protein